MITVLLGVVVTGVSLALLVWAAVVVLVRYLNRALAAEARMLREDCAVLEEENAQLGAENLKLKLALDTTRALLRTRVREGPAVPVPLH